MKHFPLTLLVAADPQQGLRSLIASLSTPSTLAPALFYLVQKNPAELTQQGTTSPYAQYLLGTLNARQATGTSTIYLQNAETHFREALRLGHPYARLALSAVLYQQNKTPQALETLRPLTGIPEADAQKELLQALTATPKQQQQHLKKMQSLWKKQPSLNTYRNIASLQLRMPDPQAQQQALAKFSALRQTGVPNCDPKAQVLIRALPINKTQSQKERLTLTRTLKLNPLTTEIFTPQACPLGW